MKKIITFTWIMQQKLNINTNSKNNTINYQIYLFSIIFIYNSVLIHRTNDLCYKI